MSACEQNFRRKAHRLRKVSGDRRQSRQKQIAEAVAFQSRTFLKAMLEQSREQGFVFRKGDDAIAHIARRKHIELFAQTAARSAIVAHRHHTRQFANGWLTGSGQRRSHDVTLQPLQQRGEARAAADCDHAQFGASLAGVG